MPVLNVHLVEGYDADAKARLGGALTDAVRLVVPADPDLVTVMIHEHPGAHYMRGRQTRSGANALPCPEKIVIDYLTAMEARDLDTARAALGPGFTMTFPGAVSMTTLEELIAWSKPRYAHVSKCIESCEVCATPGPTVAYVRGTLNGAWPDGTSFDGIRFIDRFELEGGKITRQDVWNDVSEVCP